MIKIAGLTLTLILFLWASTRAANTLAAAEDFFKWGEYDSLIRVVEPLTDSTAKAENHQDSLLRAKCFLFLGVAFYVKGDSSKADDVFFRAANLDPKVKLDRFYVTDAIANRFHAVLARALKELPKDTTARAFQPDSIQPSPIARSDASKGFGEAEHSARVASSSGRPWLWMGLGLAAAAAAAGGYYLVAIEQEGTKDIDHTIDLRDP